jgi:hypothetical protein
MYVELPRSHKATSMITSNQPVHHTTGRRSKNDGSTTWNPLEVLSLGKVDQAPKELDETHLSAALLPLLQRIQRQRASSISPHIQSW